MQDWWAFLGWYENVFVWPLAIGALVLLARAKGARQRLISAGLLALVFLPHIQKALGDVYFDYLCRTQAGEFIYRTVDNVEGVLQMRPRDGSKDYFDRMRVGDIPEDPWGHTNLEAQEPWILFRNYRYFEKRLAGPLTPPSVVDKAWHQSMFLKPAPGDEFARYEGYDMKSIGSLRRAFERVPRSAFGYDWRESRGVLSWAFNIYPGELNVFELTTNELLGRKLGFLRVRPLSVCPPGKDETMAYEFVSKVLRPSPLMRD